MSRCVFVALTTETRRHGGTKTRRTAGVTEDEGESRTDAHSVLRQKQWQPR